MKILLLTLLAIAACAPTQSTEYRQSAFVPPPAPPMRPGVGAPEVGQPGQVGSPTVYPRSPHKRLLPPTAEPTIYSGDEPKSSLPRFDPNLGRITLPHPKHTGLGAQPFEDIEPVMDCAKGMEIALEQKNLMESYNALPRERMQCVAAQLYKHCADVLVESARAGSNLLHLSRVEAVQKVANDFLKASCPDGTGRDANMVTDAQGAWRQPI